MQAHDSHSKLFQVDPDSSPHPPLGQRLSDYARIADSFCDREELLALTTAQESPIEQEARPHLHLLRVVCAHWGLYLWLRSRIELYRWYLHRLAVGLEWSSKISRELLEYWAVNGSLAFDALDIAALQDSCLAPNALAIRDWRDGETMCWTFDELRHR